MSDLFKCDLFKCANCGHEDDYDNLPAARQLSQRLEVGEPYTNVECPECGALCYPKEEDQSNEGNLNAAAADMYAALVWAETVLDGYEPPLDDEPARKYQTGLVSLKNALKKARGEE